MNYGSYDWYFVDCGDWYTGAEYAMIMVMMVIMPCWLYVLVG